MIEVSDIDATIIYEDLNKFKSIVIKNPNFLELAEDYIDTLKNETHSNTINGCNFRRSYKVLRTMTRSAISIRDIKGIDSNNLIDYFLRVLNPMLKALENNVINKPTQAQSEEIKLVRAKNKLLLLDNSIRTESEVDEDIDESVISKFILSSNDDLKLKELEQTLRNSIITKLDKNKKQEFKIEKLLPKQHLDKDEGNKPFSSLGKLLKEKSLSTDDLLQFIKNNGPDSVLTLTEKQRKKLFKLLPKENRDLMVKSDDYLIEQLNSLKEYTLDKYDIPTLTETDTFKLFTAPIFTVTSPYIQQSSLAHIQDLTAKLIFPGWLLDNQVIATIPTNVYKSKDYSKTVKTICSMLKTRTKQPWIHISDGMEFKLKGYPNQTFLWFIPYSYTKYLGTFSIEDLSFPFYLNTVNNANIQDLKTKRLHREKAVDELLLPLYNKMNDMYSKAEKYDKQVDNILSLLDNFNTQLDSLNTIKTVNMEIRLKIFNKKNKLNKVITKLNDRIDKYSTLSKDLVKKGNCWYKKLKTLDKTLKTSTIDLSTVDLSFFEE